MADVTVDFVTDVTYDTVKRLKRHLAIPPYRHTNIQQHSRYYTGQVHGSNYEHKLIELYRKADKTSQTYF
jgi:hypothetical protein